jgi:hypothetical protein
MTGARTVASSAGLAGAIDRGEVSEPQAPLSAPTIPDRLPSSANVQPLSVGVTVTLPMPSARIAAPVCVASLGLTTGPRHFSHSTLAANAFSKSACSTVKPAGAGLRDGPLNKFRRHFGEDQVVELALVVSMANFTNRFNNGLRVEPDLG